MFHRNKTKLGIVLIIVLSAALIPTQVWSSSPDPNTGYNSLAAAARIHDAMDDIKSEFGITEVTDAYNNNDRGAALNSDEENEDWESFGFWVVATFGRNLAEHQNSFNYNAYLFGIKDTQYAKSVKIGQHQGAVNSKYEDGKLQVQVLWGNPSLFAYFGADLTVNDFNSLTKEQKDTLISKVQDKAVEYATKLEGSLVRHKAYDVPYEIPEEEKEHLPVIFLPGVAGSYLYEKDTVSDDMLWPLAPIDDRADLFLKDDGITPKTEGVKIVPGDILRSSVEKLNFYGSMIKFLESKGYKQGKDLFVFPYDWRLHNTLHLKALDKIVDDALFKANAEKVILIAHSMGGLIARAYVNSLGAEKVDTLITMGTPFYGAVKPYYALVSGYDFGNDSVNPGLMKVLAQNAPSVYEILPRIPFVKDEKTQEPLSLDDTYLIAYKGIKDVDRNVFIKDVYTETEENDWVVNSDLVEQANNFHNILGTKDNPKPLPKGVKHYVIIGYGFATLSGYSLRDANEGEKFLEWMGHARHVVLIPRFGDGDGTVPLWSAEISGVTATYYVPHLSDTNSAAHGDLAKNPSIQKIVGDIISKKPPPSMSYPGKGTLNSLEDMVTFILHSDAHLSVADEKTGGRLGFNEQGGIDEKLSSGTFLSIEGVEYVAIADTTKTYKVLVDGITDGKFTLSAEIRRAGVTTAKFSYQEVEVTKDTVAQFNINPSRITPDNPPPVLEVSADGKSTSVPAQVQVLTVAPSQTQPSQTGNEIFEKGGEVVEKGSEVLQQAGDVLQKGGGGGCLIATAAFGSELTPQVQFLRNFRDHRILSTLAGSSFMNAFNAWYYSFSPYVANYEREQPWLQQTIKTALYPLLGILHLSEIGYSSMSGDYGAVTAGFIASSMIGALYFWPFALSITRVRSVRFDYRLALLVVAIAFVSVIGSILSSNALALMVSTSIFVLSILSVSAMLSAKMILALVNRFRF